MTARATMYPWRTRMGTADAKTERTPSADALKRSRSAVGASRGAARRRSTAAAMAPPMEKMTKKAEKRM
uniref:Uncharacterized protein n=1 Tax=Arundo donax TaxID=35708 RepID=A0A0A9G968_ARUDO